MNKTAKHTLLASLLIIIGITARLTHHQANFAPVGAIALLSAGYLPKKVSWLVPAIIMSVSDVFLGLHNVIAFTWGSYILIALLGSVFYSKFKKRWPLAISGPIASSIFFIITNFGVWLMSGMYSHNLNGIVRCYELAVPFFRPSLISDTVFTLGFFIIAELVQGVAKINPNKNTHTKLVEG